MDALTQRMTLFCSSQTIWGKPASWMRVKLSYEIFLKEESRSAYLTRRISEETDLSSATQAILAFLKDSSKKGAI